MPITCLTSSCDIGAATCPFGTEAQRIISSNPGSFQKKTSLMFSLPVFLRLIQVVEPSVARSPAMDVQIFAHRRPIFGCDFSM
jgi:hypothetical protein